MFRWLIRILCGLSIALFVGSVGLWIRSFYVADELRTGNAELVSSCGRILYIYQVGGWAPRSRLIWITEGEPVSLFTIKFLFRWDSTHIVGFPHWILALLATPLPAWWAVLHVRRRRLLLRVHCKTCGYDLRASPDRCPECGTAVPARPSDQDVQPQSHREHREDTE